ncbi:MAG TPA: ABC transporter ATP-binding protein [Jiangellaceae bacterium]|jgi:ABC-2 type transport system ATP-binding protein|nr:ABC transporter ATP-binding protein [Jiangellaceae bacterium]
MTEPVVLTEDLTKFYGEHLGMDGLDLEVRSGEVFGFIGPNGAGKTTTIRLLLDLIRPTRGRLRVLGQDPRSGGATLRRRLSYLPGELPLDGRQSARELLTFLGNLRGGVAQERIDRLAERLKLDLSRPIRGLSKGNKQKVGLVQAFMHDPELLILDEPSSGLDPLLQHEFLAMVREVRASGRTVFMSSHVLAEVEHVADRVGILRAGRLVAVEDIEVLRQRAVRRVEIRFGAPVPAAAFQRLPGMRDVAMNGELLRCVVEGSADALVKAAAQFPVVSLLSHEPDLEEIFLTYYQSKEGERDAA